MPNSRYGTTLTALAVTLALTGALAAWAGASMQGPASAIIDVLIRPVRDGRPEVTAVAVRVELSGEHLASSGPFSIRAPITYASVTGIADRIEALQLADPDGVVPVTIQDDPVDPGGFPHYRHWQAARAVMFPATLTYRSRPQSTPPTPGPVFSLRAHHGGISAAGSGFLALPEKTDPSRLRVRWDLSDLTPGATAASTFGEGDVELTGEPAELLQAYYMAGPMGRRAPPDTKGTFVAYWLGTPPFDPVKEMTWAQRVYARQQAFFGETAPRPYRVFLRALPGATGRLGGTALQNSFMAALPVGSADPAEEAPRESIAHEMTHMFVGDLAGGPSSGSPWFTEGLTVHYTRLVLLRAGLWPVSAYEASVNNTARGYYSNRYRTESAASLDRLGFSAGIGAGGAQNVPYTRGSLYFAMVDQKIRQASAGRRSLDDVMLPLFDARRHGKPFDREMLVLALAKEYGPSARTDFDAIIVRGETVVPPAGSFGPCLERRPTRIAAPDGEVEGFAWVRVPSVPDARCRQW